MPLSASQTANIQKQYDPLRKRAEQQEAVNRQQQDDALKRRFAAGAPGGAMIKQQQVLADQSARRLQDANEGINAQQQAALNQAQQVQEQRDWQTGERVAGQKFSSGEAALQRKFLTGERLGSQNFASQQARDAYLRQRAEGNRQRDFMRSESAKGRALQESQFIRQMDRDFERLMWEQEVDRFNMDMANKMFEKKDILEKMLSGESLGQIDLLGQFVQGISGGGWEGGLSGVPSMGAAGMFSTGGRRWY